MAARSLALASASSCAARETSASVRLDELRRGMSSKASTVALRSMGWAAGRVMSDARPGSVPAGRAGRLSAAREDVRLGYRVRLAMAAEG